MKFESLSNSKLKIKKKFGNNKGQIDNKKILWLKEGTFANNLIIIIYRTLWKWLQCWLESVGKKCYFLSDFQFENHLNFLQYILTWAWICSAYIWTWLQWAMFDYRYHKSLDLKLFGVLAIDIAIEIMAHQQLIIRQPVCFYFGEIFGSSASLAY